MTQPSRSKQPWPVLDHVFAFPPNRDTLGATAYFIVGNPINILIDCPPWQDTYQDFLQAHGGVQFLFLTHRGAIGKLREIQEATHCQIVIQEQEAYLLPGLPVTAFTQEWELTPDCVALWTPGHSPGSACLYYRQLGGVLFTGRHLLPNAQGEPWPLKTAKTFHWPRQWQSVQRLQTYFASAPLAYLCPGAHTGPLRGERVITDARQRLMTIVPERGQETESLSSP